MTTQETFTNTLRYLSTDIEQSNDPGIPAGMLNVLLTALGVELTDREIYKLTHEQVEQLSERLGDRGEPRKKPQKEPYNRPTTGQNREDM